MSQRDQKVERLVSVQSRVDLTSLAKLDLYWKGEGYDLPTVSRLVSWSVDLLVEVLEANGKSKVEISLREAHNYMQSRGLIQRKMMGRGKKLSAGLRFESIREEGFEPREVCPHDFNVVHSNKPVPFSGTVTGGKYLDVIEEAIKRSKEEYKKEALAVARENHLVSGDLIPDRDKEIIEKENQPIDLTRLKDRIVKE